MDRAIGIFGLALTAVFGIWSLSPEGWPRMSAWAAFSGLVFGVLLVGLAIGLVIGERRSGHPVDSTIPPRFFSLFGRYKLGPINIYQRNDFGVPLGQTVNLIEERDKIVQVKPIIRWLYYEVCLVTPGTLAIAHLKRSSCDKTWRTVHFGILG